MNIIINRMYAGGYLNLSENMIGHEAINLVETDKDENGNKHRFIWLNANGKCSKENIEGKGDSIILLVRNVDDPGVVQVIARAKVKNNKVLDGMDSQSRYLRESQQPRELMYYGGKNVYDIFASNRVGHKGEEDTYATFEVEDFRIPKNEMFLTDKDSLRDNVFDVRTDKVKNFAKSSLRQFIEYNEAPTYMDDEKWYTYDAIPDSRKTLFGSVDEKNSLSATSRAGLIDIIGDTYHELSYSNFLAYFLNQESILDEFAKYVLGISDLDVENCVIAREEYNIDILIQSSKYVIVIENKIKSGITEGVKGTTIDKQIQKMFEGEKDGKKLKDEFLSSYGTSRVDRGNISYGLNDILCETTGVSQLSKYYLYAQKIANRREVVCFVLAPDYHINSLGLNNYFYGNKYSPLQYSKIKDFFEKYKENHSNTVRFIQDYIDAIDPHSKPFDNYLEDKLLQRFRNAIGNGATDEQTKKLHKQLSFCTFKKESGNEDELIAKYVMLLRVKYLMFKGNDQANSNTIEYFSLTDNEIEEGIALAGLKYLKLKKCKGDQALSLSLSNDTIDLICAYGNFNMKFKKVEEIEKKLRETENYMNKIQVRDKCYEIGNSINCGYELYEVFKDYVLCDKKHFKEVIGQNSEKPVKESIKERINGKLTKEIEEAESIFEKIKNKS